MPSRGSELTLAQLLERMANDAGFRPETMELLGQFAPEAVFEHAQNKQFAFSGPSLPPKMKMLLTIAVAAALGSDRCTENYVRSARNKGVSTDEIVEALLVARFVKATTVISASTPALRWLVEEQDQA